MTRKITDEEKKLWKYATRGVKGEAGEESDSGIENFFPPKHKVRLTPQSEMLTPLVKKKAPKELVEGKTNAMDGGSFRRLFQGKTRIEGTIDLHGMWLAEAHNSVRDFIIMSRAAGKRCILVITGKGGIRGDGKIKAEFPKWINDSEIRPLVLSFTQAAQEHGGAGAFYVYLRK